MATNAWYGGYQALVLRVPEGLVLKIPEGLVLKIPRGLVLKIPRGLVLKTNTVFVCRVAILGLIPFAFYSLFHTFAEMEKRAIIVGASSGIGREVALSLLAEGWRDKGGCG